MLSGSGKLAVLCSPVGCPACHKALQVCDIDASFACASTLLWCRPDWAHPAASGSAAARPSRRPPSSAAAGQPLRPWLGRLGRVLHPGWQDACRFLEGGSRGPQLPSGSPRGSAGSSSSGWPCTSGTPSCRHAAACPYCQASRSTAAAAASRTAAAAAGSRASQAGAWPWR